MPPNPRAVEATEALRAACARSAELASDPVFEKLKAETDSTVDAALELARSARKTSPAGPMRAVRPGTDLTGKFKAFK